MRSRTLEKEIELKPLTGIGNATNQDNSSLRQSRRAIGSFSSVYYVGIALAFVLVVTPWSAPGEYITMATNEVTKAGSEQIKSEQIKTTANGNFPILTTPKEQQQRLIMYVGPIKTASTTLQYILSKYNKTLQEDDGFNVQGRLSPGPIRLPVLASMLDRTCKYKKNAKFSECWKNVRNELEASSKSILIVEEDLCKLTFDLPSFIDTVFPRYSVELVLGYRRLYHWLGSAKNEYEKKYGGYPHPTTTAADVAQMPYFTDRDRHPSNVGFFETFANATIRHHFMEKKGRLDFTCNSLQAGCGLKYMDLIVAAYQPLLDAGARLRFTNIHDNERSPQEQFYCNILNASATCSAIMDKRKQFSSKNPSQSLEYDRIAVQAFDQGLFEPIENNRYYRQRIGNKLRQYHETKLGSKPLPLECENDTALDTLLQESIRLEREFVPHLFNETDLRQDFEMTRSKGKFCSVNATAVLEDPEWREIFTVGHWLKDVAMIHNSNNQ